MDVAAWGLKVGPRVARRGVDARPAEQCDREDAHGSAQDGRLRVTAHLGALAGADRGAADHNRRDGQQRRLEHTDAELGRHGVVTSFSRMGRDRCSGRLQGCPRGEISAIRVTSEISSRRFEKSRRSDCECLAVPRQCTNCGC